MAGNPVTGGFDPHSLPPRNPLETGLSYELVCPWASSRTSKQIVSRPHVQACQNCGLDSDDSLTPLLHDGEWYIFAVCRFNVALFPALRTFSLTGEPPRPTIAAQWSLHPNSS
ncbi:MAG TPA: hypothetical protein VFQ43_13675, partial [Nitrososphaera sp.]|nr:hypothetical protein [Nitrososphaera sp.]